MFSCGLSTDGKAYCWDHEVPVVPTPVTGGLTFASVESGSGHACGLTPDGLAYCWGNNGRGQLGNEGGSSFSPTPVSGGLRFAALSVGSSHACGLTDEDTAHCWGYNGYGQLGASTGETCAFAGSTHPCSRTPVAVTGGLRFTDVSAGGPHTCAVTADGDAFCWGWNVAGQLGTGDTVSHSQPAAVAGGIRFRTISASAHGLYATAHTCGIAVGGTAHCWGAGEVMPVPVAGFQFTSVSTGAGFTCGIAASGGAYCWGGLPTLGKPWVASETPVRVFGQP
jgi:alpha-tubulin suppressor-like RCC1 family protein